MIPKVIVVIVNWNDERFLDRCLSALLAQNENLGFACGNNLAIEVAADESEWVALLNSDAFAEPRRPYRRSDLQLLIEKWN